MDKTVIRLEGRIDTNNSSVWEKKIFDAVGASPSHDFYFDGSALEYISSSGLRILMKFRKTTGKTVTITGVSPEVFDILETTGFTELFDVKKKLREVSVEGCELIGEGFYGKVYRIDDETIVKVYSSENAISMIENEKKMAKLAFVKGIPTAISYDIVRVGNTYGSVFELLKAKSFNDIVRSNSEDLENIVRKYVDCLKYVHSIEMDKGTVPYAKDHFLHYLDVIRESIGEEQYDALNKLLQEMPENNHAIHGDFQMKNLMLDGNEPMLIDMDTLSAGDPVFDLAGIYATYRMFGEDEPDNSMNFLGISRETADRILELTLKYYFEDADKDRLAVITDRIALACCIRFLYIVLISDLKNSDIGKLRIRHAGEHIKELLGRVTSLVTV